MLIFRVAGALLAVPALLGALPACADTVAPPPAIMEGPLRDPWVPPSARKPSLAPPTRDAALRRQVEQKLQAAFNAADTQGSGSLTLTQAKAANLGLIVRHFDQIDANGTGTVQFQDVKQFLKRRGAQLD